MGTTLGGLLQKFTQYKYPMDTGSEEWWDIKTDFELLCDAVVGVVAHEDYGKSVGLERVSALSSELDGFMKRVENFPPKDEAEAAEKMLLQRKAKVGLEICSIIIDHLKS